MSDGKSNMPLKTRLLIHLRSEREKISYLSRREKLSYILEYYWIWIVGIIAAVSFLIFFTYRMFFVSKDYWFYAIYANTTADAGERSALWYDFADYEGFDLKEKSMVMNAASYFDPSVRGGTVNSYFQSFVQSLACRVCRASTGVGGCLHTEEAGESAEEPSCEESEGYPRVLGVEAIGHDGEDNGQHDKDDEHHAVLLSQIGHRTPSDVEGDLLHAR